MIKDTVLYGYIFVERHIFSGINCFSSVNFKDLCLFATFIAV